MKNKIKIYGGMLIILLLITPIVSAFAVTTPYWDTKPLVLQPGETREVSLFLQNMQSEKDITLKANLVEGKEIATILDESLEYLVPFGRKDIPVRLRITIPADYPLGENYKVAVSFAQKPEEEGKMVQLVGGVKGYIPVVVAWPEEEQQPEQEAFFSTTTMTIIMLLVVIVMIIVGYLVLQKRKETNKE